MTLSTSIRAYREAEILAASPSRLVVITYDGLLMYLVRARAAIAAHNVEETFRALDRARGFVGELLAALDHEKGGACAGPLASIYVYLLTQLQTQGRTRTAAQLDQVIDLVRELRGAFADIATAPRSAVA